MDSTRSDSAELNESPIAERYSIDHFPVGTGGFGKVRPGFDNVLQRKIAVKTLNELWSHATSEDQERFRREARTLAKLNHPNIPAIYDVVFGDGTFAIYFQFVEGKTLRSIIDEEEVVRLEDCRRWFDQIASALQHAHDSSIIHRDVKPDNMIVTSDRRHCYLVDFGIALSSEELERLTGSDSWIGTPGYMSPEQEECKELDPSDDLYVLGVCLYEALSGHRISPGSYQSLNSLNELIPPAIDELVQKCIASKPQRIKTAAAFREQLRSALHLHRTLSEVLARGQLHEIVNAINQMMPDDFMRMKAGQRLLILQKCHDVVASNDARLAAARIEFLVVMTRLGVLLEPAEYGKIVDPAIHNGFGAVAEGASRGNYRIREALVESAMIVNSENHRVISDSALNWLARIELDKQPGWFFHSVRQLVQALMANQNCSDQDAPRLAATLANVNELQRALGESFS